MTTTNDFNATARRAGTVLLWLAFLVLILSGLRTVGGADIWFHLASGRHALEHGPAHIDPFSFGLPENTVWRQTTWLYDLGLYGAWQAGGAPLIVAGHVLAVVAAFWVLLPVARRYSDPLHQAVALLLSTWLIAPLFTVRPLLFSLLPLALMIRWLDGDRPAAGTTTGLLITQAVWANLHGSFILGPLLALLRLLEAWRHNAGSRVLVQYAALLAGLIGVTLLNPFGFFAWREAWHSFAGPDGVVTLEFVSPFYSDFGGGHFTFLTATALGLIGAVFIFRRERLPLMITSCAALGAYTLTRAHDVLDLAALLIFPFVAMSIATLSMLVRARMSVSTCRTALAAGMVMIGAAGIFSAGWIVTNRYYVHNGFASGFGLRTNTEVLPVAAVEAMRTHGISPKRLINVAHDGGYLLWQWPGRRVYTDPRGTLYGRAFFQEFAHALAGKAPLPESDAILLNATWSGARLAAAHFLSNPQWAVAYFDGTSLLLLRRTSENRAALENGALQEAGLPYIRAAYRRYEAALGGLRKPAIPARLVGAAYVYQASQRFAEARTLLAILTRGAPRMAVAWANRGLMALQAGNTSEAIAVLEEATRRLPGHPLPWVWLGRAYQEAGRDDDAKMASQRAEKVDPILARRIDHDQTILETAPQP